MLKKAIESVRIHIRRKEILYRELLETQTHNEELSGVIQMKNQRIQAVEDQRDECLAQLKQEKSYIENLVSQYGSKLEQRKITLKKRNEAITQN